MKEGGTVGYLTTNNDEPSMINQTVSHKNDLKYLQFTLGNRKFYPSFNG
jgi:hypothetical protein